MPGACTRRRIATYIELAQGAIPPTVGTDRRRANRARRLGGGAALVYCLIFIPVSMYSYEATVLYFLLAPVVIVAAASAVAAAAARSVRAGVEAGLWAGLVSALLTFAIRLLTLLNGYQRDAAFRDDIEPGAVPDPEVWLPRLLGQDLGSGIFGLVFLPTWTALLGLIGGRLGQAAARHS